MLAFLDRTVKGQTEESNEDQTVAKRLRVMSVNHDPSHACSDDMQMNSDSQRQEALMRH